MLKRPERDDDQLELFAQFKLGHVGLHKMHAFTFFLVESRALLRGAFQHALGKVESRDALARLRERHRNTSGAATEFEHWVAKFPRSVAVKRYILRALPHNRRFIVIVRDERVVQGGRQFLFVRRQGRSSIETKAKR